MWIAERGGEGETGNENVKLISPFNGEDKHAVHHIIDGMLTEINSKVLAQKNPATNTYNIVTLHPQYIKDANGERSLVVLPVDEFDTIMEELEAIEDVKLYDEAKKDDPSERMLFSDYVKKQKSKNCLGTQLYCLKAHKSN